MYTGKNVRIPKHTKQVLQEISTVRGTARALRDVMHRYVESKETVFAMVTRTLQRRMVSSPQPEGELILTNFSCDPNDCTKFSEMADLFGFSFDALFRMALEDYLINHDHGESLPS